jgi:DNA-binding MarR family transcriptional regulator
MCIYTYRMAPDPLLATRHCRCLAARREARALTRLFEANLRPFGLRATQFSVLAALALKGATPVSALADFLVLERTTLTRVAAVLERNGWVTVRPGADGRLRPLLITAKGRRKVEAAFPAWQAAQSRSTSS